MNAFYSYSYFVCVCYGLSGEGVKDEATSDNILDTVEDLKYVSTFHSHQPNGYVRTTNSTTKFALVDLLPPPHLQCSFK